MTLGGRSSTLLSTLSSLRLNMPGGHWVGGNMASGHEGNVSMALRRARLLWEEIIAFGGFLDISKTGFSTIERIWAQPNADLSQLERRCISHNIGTPYTDRVTFWNQDLYSIYNW